MNFNKLDEKRIENRFSVTQFCQLVGIDRSSYYNYMANPDTIKVSTLEKMFDVLSLSKKDRMQIML